MYKCTSAPLDTSASIETTTLVENAKNAHDILNTIRREDAKNLTAHLLNSHGITVKQKIRTVSATLKGKRIFGDNEETSWRPSKRWTAWPKEPQNLITERKQVWKDSPVFNSDFGSPTELKDAMFSVLLSLANHLWYQRDLNKDSMREAHHEESPPVLDRFLGPQPREICGAVRMLSSETEDADPVKNFSTHMRDDGHSSGSDSLQSDEPVFCADETKLRRILNPLICSTSANVDSLLAILQRSRIGHCEMRSRRYTHGFKRSQSRRTLHKASTLPHYSSSRSKNGSTSNSHIEFQLREWSEILGFASAAGFSPAAILRAASRCSEIFGENMKFFDLKEGAHPVMSRTPAVLSTGSPLPQVISTRTSDV